MECLASVLTLIDVAVKTSKVIKDLTQSYKNCPATIEDLRHRILGWTLHLLLLRHVVVGLSNCRSALNFDDFEVIQLEASLAITVTVFKEILGSLKMQSARTGRTAQIRWAISDESKVAAWEKRLRRHAEILQTTLILLESRYSSLMYDEIREAKNNVQARTTDSRVISLTPMSQFSWASSRWGSDWEIPYVAKVDGSLRCSTHHDHLSYALSLRLRAPFILQTFSLYMRFKRQSLFWLEVSPIGFELAFKRVVPVDSAIMIACKSGTKTDLRTVRDLIGGKVASVQDITVDNFTPLSYAIAGGSIDILSLLVSSGADTSKTFGRFQTSSLEWAFAHRQLHIARWLLHNNNVDTDHVGARGWTPVFSLFGVESRHQEPIEAYLDLLQKASFDNWNAKDTSGWTVLHRAAAYGTGNQIKSLLARGASPSTRISILGWTPIFYAVQFNNRSALEALLEVLPDFATISDARDWTLLHIAVNRQALEVMHLLVEAGADPHTLSSPEKKYTPDDLRDCALTPGDIALVRGPLVFEAYSSALKAKGYAFGAIKEGQDGSISVAPLVADLAVAEHEPTMSKLFARYGLTKNRIAASDCMQPYSYARD